MYIYDDKYDLHFISAREVEFSPFKAIAEDKKYLNQILELSFEKNKSGNRRKSCPPVVSSCSRMYLKISFLKMIKTLDGVEKGLTLTLSQTTNFRLFQTKRICRRQFSI